MIQAKQQTRVTFVTNPPKKNTIIKTLPKIVWEVPPPDFEIPDEPMDNFDQSLLAEALREALSLAKRISENQICATSLAVCAKVDGQTITKAPDWFYVPYVHPSKKNRRSYTPNANGDLPTIVMEFLSDQQGKEYDNSSIPPYGKWYFYETILQIPWYVIFDSDNGELEVYHQENCCYKKQNPDDNGRYWIDSIELFLGIWKGWKQDVYRNTFWLRWWDATGKRLSWQYENTIAVENARHRALKKAEKAENEKQKALEEVKQIANNTTRQIAKQMLHANIEIAIIQQITGLDAKEIMVNGE